MIRIEANIPFIEPPQWAILERSLIDLMNGSVDPVMEHYVRSDGSILRPTSEEFSSIDGLDDAYESFHNWPLFYLLSGGDHYSGIFPPHLGGDHPAVDPLRYGPRTSYGCQGIRAVLRLDAPR